jgi:hypothetical protein
VYSFLFPKWLQGKFRPQPPWSITARSAWTTPDIRFQAIARL